MFVFLSLIIAIASLSLVLSKSSTRPVDQIEHIIIFMQENRPFDHYMGKMKGVRGFNDRTTVPLRSGLNAFHQPVDQKDLTKYMLPFRTESNITNAMCMPAPEMYYPTDIKMWNSGRMDSWNTARDAGLGMSYFTRDEIPFYYELYDNFATGDHYYMSTFTSTTPNRLVLFSGSNGLSVPDAGGYNILENNEPRPGYNWTTMGEILEASNISWRVYQQADNFDDNGFAWFWNYQKARPGEPLFDKGMMRQLHFIDAFKKDMEDGTLPQVSWMIAPTRKSEHATHHPVEGEDLTARILQTLSEFPEIYAKTAFILNYDEGGQFYDHAWSPTPPLSPQEGVSTVTVDGEINKDVLTSVPAPIGLGFRVPLLIVSPWTRGNIVVSEAFDHTSVIKFLEYRFNVSNPNISPWRRAMVGDLTSAFDFENPNYDWPRLPKTRGYVAKGWVECKTLPPVTVPEVQSMPKQEPGTRISRSLPYEFIVRDTISSAGVLEVAIDNSGSAGAPFVLYDVANLETINPRQYAVEAGKSITDLVNIPAASLPDYHYALMGINGFVRELQGDASSSSQCINAAVSLTYSAATHEVVINLSNNNAASTSGGASIEFSIQDNAYNQLNNEVVSVTVLGASKITKSINTRISGHWYDLTVSVQLPSSSSSSTSSSPCLSRRFMGRMETGKDSISDPAMGSGLPGLWGSNADGAHPLLDAKFRKIERIDGRFAPSDNKDAGFYLEQFIDPAI